MANMGIRTKKIHRNDRNNRTERMYRNDLNNRAESVHSNDLYNRREKASGGNPTIRPEGRGLKFISTLLIMYVLTGVMLFILAFLLYRFKLSENMVSVGIMGVYILAGFLGGMIVGRRMGSRCFLWGLAVGSIYFCILFAGSVILEKGIPDNTLKMASIWVMCACACMIGGMVAIKD